MKLCPRTLTQFAAVAREGSFTRAAQHLGVAQPWLSTRIRRLEAHIGCTLIDRTTRHFELTAQGRELLERAERIADEVEAAERLADRMRFASARVLRLGVPPYSERIATRRTLLDAFTASHPEIRLEWDTAWSPRLAERLKSGALDAAFTYGSDDAQRLQHLQVDSFGIRLFFRPDNPLRRESQLRTDMLRGRQVAVFRRSLNPNLFDIQFSSLAKAGASLVEFTEAESMFDNLRDHPDMLIAKSDFVAPPSSVGYAWRDLADHPRLPWNLSRERHADRPALRQFWSFASDWLARTRSISERTGPFLELPIAMAY